MSDEWLSLSGAAAVLGVHPSTVRNWADEGLVPVHRTSGGHRRFKQAEIELWLKSRGSENHQADIDGIIQNALKRTRMQIGEGFLHAEAWYQKLDEEARQQYSQSGRALLQGLIGYLGANNLSSSAEARSLGYEYASRGRRCGLSSVEAMNAFLFFRNQLLEAVLGSYEVAGVRSPQAWGEMLRKIHAFTDEIMITLVETYEAYQRGGR